MATKRPIRWLCLGDGHLIRFDGRKSDIRFVDGSDGLKWSEEGRSAAAHTLAWAIGVCRSVIGKDRTTLVASLMNSSKLNDDNQNPDDQFRLAMFAVEIAPLSGAITIEGLLVA